MRLISQLTDGVSGVPQKLLNYFNSTDILTSFTLPAAGVFPVILVLDFSDSEFGIVAAGSSL